MICFFINVPQLISSEGDIVNCRADMDCEVYSVNDHYCSPVSTFLRKNSIHQLFVKQHVVVQDFKCNAVYFHCHK
jgi:hypothetical protein